MIADIAIFIAVMIINNCPNNYSGVDTCFARFLGPCTFQPLTENSLLRPSSATWLKMGAYQWDKVVHQHQGWRLISCLWFMVTCWCISSRSQNCDLVDCWSPLRRAFWLRCFNMDPSKTTTRITIESIHKSLNDICSSYNFTTTGELHFGIGHDGTLNFVSSLPPPTLTSHVISDSCEDSLTNAINSLSLEDNISVEASGSGSKQVLASKGKWFKKRGPKGKFTNKGNKMRSGTSNGPQVNDQCHYCKIMGHWLRNCPLYLEHIREGIVIPLGFKKGGKAKQRGY